MRKGSTLLLKIVIAVLGLLVLSLCLFGLPQLIMSELQGDFDYGWIFVGMYIPAVPFFYALYQGFQLLGYIDHNKAFTELSVVALRRIKYCAFIVSALYAAGMPYVFYVADRDDAPGLALIGFIIISASFVVATASAVFEQLFQNAVDIKSENDLTV